MIALVVCACRREQPIAADEHAAPRDTAGDVSDADAADASTETLVVDAFTPFRIGKYDAWDAVMSLSPAYKRLASTKGLSGNPGSLLEEEPQGCSASVPDCEWVITVGVHLPERFSLWEVCRVHAYSGEVRCHDVSTDTKRSVGFAKPRVRDAAAD